METIGIGVLVGLILFILFLLACCCVYHKKQKKKFKLRDLERGTGSHQGYGSREQRSLYDNQTQANPGSSSKAWIQPKIYFEEATNTVTTQPSNTYGVERETNNKTPVTQVHHNCDSNKTTNVGQVQSKPTHQRSGSYGIERDTNFTGVQHVHHNFEPTETVIGAQIQPNPNSHYGSTTSTLQLSYNNKEEGTTNRTSMAREHFDNKPFRRPFLEQTNFAVPNPSLDAALWVILPIT
jgi:hypothetical protein